MMIFLVHKEDDFTAGKKFKGINNTYDLEDISMKKGLTEIVFILDRSGSMSGLEADTIGGFNAMIAKQKKEDGEAYVSTVLFDDRCEVLHDRISMDEVPFMTEDEYYVRGCTALLDAVGGAIHHIANVHKYAREEDRPEKTLFIITTDGMENASKHYSYDKVQKMIKKEQEKYGWEFLFIGANIDATKEAGKFGIKKERAVNYVHDEVGIREVYKSVSKAVCAVRMADKPCDALDMCSWGEDIERDFQNRGNQKGGRR